MQNFGGNNLILIAILFMFMQGGNIFGDNMLLIVLIFMMMQGTPLFGCSTEN